MNNKGQTIVEIMITMGLFAVLAPAILTGFVATREGRPMRENRIEATGLLREAEEALKVAREEDWGNVSTSGLYHPTIVGNTWNLASGAELIDNFYTRQILIEDIQRDENFNIVASGGTLDPSTKKATITIEWDEPRNDYLQSIIYLTRFINNTSMENTTESDFNNGTFSSTETTTIGDGAVILESSTSTYTEEYIDENGYDFDDQKIEIFNGVARLKDLGGSNGSTIDASFDDRDWGFLTFGDSPSPDDQYLSSGGNPGDYGRINFPNQKNKIMSGYWTQQFEITESDVDAKLSFDWNVTTYTGAPDSFHVYAYIDTNNGTPTNLVWDSGNITGTSSWSSVIDLDVSSYVLTPDQYYLKVGAYVDYSNNRRQYRAGFDNILLEWESTGGGGNYDTSEPTITWNSSFNKTGGSDWVGFSTGETTNGGSIKYQISNDDGNTWYYHNGTSWVTAGTGDYNSAGEIDNNIATFSPTGNPNKIMVKAFLISDGTQLVQLDYVSVEYLGGGGGASNGTFTSSSFNAGDEVAWNRIEWVEETPGDSSVEFQIATNNDDSTWNFVGPDGTGNTFFTGEEGVISLNNVLGQYFQYKIYLETISGDLPYVEEVSVNYSP